MKNFHLVLVVFALFQSAPCWAKSASISDFFPVCTANQDAAHGRTLTVDPSGKTPGSLRNITAALQTAKGGDTISLMTGSYGALAISGVNKGGFVTIAAAPGQTPLFSKISVGGNNAASHWRLIGLTISGLAQGNLVLVLNGDNIVFERNNVHSQDGKLDWKPEPGTVRVNLLSSGISARQSSCVSIVDNEFHNVWHAIDFGGDQKNNNGKFFLVSGNAIDNFAGDGIEHYGSHVRILNNRITDAHGVCNNQCVHNDGIQGWNYNGIPFTNTDIVIAGNQIIVQTTPDLVLPADTLQGITIFDGKWDGVKIYNNVVITNTWHGISVYGVHNAEIINNTVAPVNSGKMPIPWIMVNKGKKDPPGTTYNAVRRNNVLPGVIRPIPPAPGFTWDHDIAFRSIDEYARAFVKFDPANFSYDMRPSKVSPLIGAGSRDGAPATDIEGRPRTGAIDVGAYAYTGK